MYINYILLICVITKTNLNIFKFLRQEIVQAYLINIINYCFKL